MGERLSGAQKRQRKRCESKKKFSSWSGAQRFIDQQEKRGLTKDRLGKEKPLRPYICKVCFKIHIGHIPTNELDKEKRR